MSNYWEKIERSDEVDSEYRATCMICGEPLTGRHKFYCSVMCQHVARSSRALKNYREEQALIRARQQRKADAFEKKAQVIRTRGQMCDDCVWRSKVDHRKCVMPSCFRGKGIGYERGDSLLAALGEDSGDGADPAAETP